MARSFVFFCALAALLVLSTHAEESQQSPPKPAAAAAEPAVNTAELDQARTELEAAHAQIAEQAAEVTTLKDKAANHQSKAEVLTKQLEKVEGTANKYKQQTTALNKEVQTLKESLTQVEELEKELAAAKEGMAKAESDRKSIGGEIQSEWEGKLAAANQATKDANKETATLQAMLESSDVQTYLQMRDMTSETVAVASARSAELLQTASEYTDTAGHVLAEHYDTAWSEAQKLAAEHSPMAEDLHKQVLDTGAPLVNQASAAIKTGLDTSVASVFEMLDGVDATKPYAKDASWWIVMSAAGLPGFFVAFFVFKYFVTLTSSLLLKMQFAGVFFMLGGVLTVHNLAVATSSDPISLLKQQEPALDDNVHFVLAVIAVTLSALHFITLVAKDNGGKSIKAQFASMIAAVLVVVVFCHYYFLVYLKRDDPTFGIKLEYSADGHPSYFEYSLFFLALVLFTGLGLPHDFRFTARALYTALESGFAGTLCSLCVLSAVVPDAFAAALTQDCFKWTCLGLAMLLVAVLAYRVIKKLSKGIFGGVLAMLHLSIVCRVLYIVKRMGDNNLPVGANLKFAAAGFMFVSIVHMFWVTFGKDHGKTAQAVIAPAKKVVSAKAGKPNKKK